MNHKDPEAPLHRAHLEVAADRPKDRLEVLRDLTRSLYEVFAIDESKQDLTLDITAWQLDNLFVTIGWTGTHGRRRTAQHISETPFDYLRLQVLRGGRIQRLFDDFELTMSPGAVYLVDYGRPMVARDDAGERLSIYIPYDAVGYDPSRHPAHFSFGLNSGIGLILNSSLNSLTEALPDARQADANPLALGFSGMLRGLLFGGHDSHDDASVQAARAGAMRKFLDRNLRDPGLGLDTLGKAFGASRATIYRDFAEFGGVERYIARRRLEAAYRELAASCPERGVVGQVAERWSYTSIHHFSRQFRELFGQPPSDIVGIWNFWQFDPSTRDGQARPSGSMQAVEEVLVNWMTRI